MTPVDRRGRSHTARAAALLATLTVGGCATSRPATPEAPVAAAIAQPFDDLNLIGDSPAQVLLRAQTTPFRAPADCAAAAREILRLDMALAPHLPQSTPTDEPSALAGAVIRSLARLPFRGVVRRLSGAEAKAEARRVAVFAGVQRRGYLEGWRAPPRCARPVDGAALPPAPPAG